MGSSVPARFRFAVKMPKWLTHEAMPGGNRGATRAVPRGDWRTWARSSAACWCNCRRAWLTIRAPSRRSSPRCARAIAARSCASRGIRRGLPAPPIAGSKHTAWDASPPIRNAREEGDEPGASARVAYFRLHGSPVMYHSSYDARYLDRLAQRIQGVHKDSGVVHLRQHRTRGSDAQRDRLALDVANGVAVADAGVTVNGESAGSDLAGDAGQVSNTCCSRRSRNSESAFAASMRPAA